MGKTLSDWTLLKDKCMYKYICRDDINEYTYIYISYFSTNKCSQAEFSDQPLVEEARAPKDSNGSFSFHKKRVRVNAKFPKNTMRNAFIAQEAEEIEPGTRDPKTNNLQELIAPAGGTAIRSIYKI